MARTKLTTDDENGKIILAYIEDSASEALVEKINKGEKGMTDCMTFIKDQARKKARNGVAMIEDKEVFGWAIHYFEEDSIKAGALRPSNVKVGVDKQIAERKEAEKEAKKKEEAKHGLDGQLDLFSLMEG